MHLKNVSHIAKISQSNRFTICCLNSKFSGSISDHPPTFHRPNRIPPYLEDDAPDADGCLAVHTNCRECPGRYGRDEGGSGGSGFVSQLISIRI